MVVKRFKKARYNLLKFGIVMQIEYVDLRNVKWF